jgi:acetate kinase
MTTIKPRRVLTINRGSSSLKFAIFGGDDREGGDPKAILTGKIDRIGLEGCTIQIVDLAAKTTVKEKLEPSVDPIAALIEHLKKQSQLDEIEFVGHRIVHGGSRRSEPAWIDSALVAELRGLIAIDPDHMPIELEAVAAIERELPGIRQVACFDTAFHAHIPRVARTLPIPYELTEEGIVRYGFHGLSYEYILGALERLDSAAVAGRVIVAHLGSGASMAAILDRACVDTTMAFSPAAGLMMGTRSGDLDPGVLIHLIKQKRLSLKELNDLVNKKSGLLGVSGISPDVADLLAVEAGNERAELALNVFCHIARKHVGGLAAVLGGIDTLVFTGGIGEHAPAIRARICSGLDFLGIDLDASQNEKGAAIVSKPNSKVTVRVVATNEEIVVARRTLELARKQDLA